MSPGFYLDDDTGMPSFVAQANSRGYRALRSDDAGMRGAADGDHLEYAASNRLILVTCNIRDFHALHFSSLERGSAHSGIIGIDQRLSLGERVRVLLWLAQAGTAEDFAGRFEFLEDWR